MVEKKSETEKVDKKAPKKTTKTKAVSKPAIKKVVKKSSAKSSAGKPVKKNKTIVEEKIEDNEVHYFDEDGGSNVSQDPVRDYLRQIGQVRMIDQKEEEDFAKRYEVGLYAQWKLDNENITDPQTIKDYNKLTADGYRCKEHLVEANLRLVVALARKYAGRGMQFQDLIQEGNNGLLRAADKYDYSTGFRFSTYATWWVRQAITRAMADQSRTIRIPVHMVEIINRMSKIEKQLAVEFGRQPNAEEIAEKMEITAEKVEEIKRYSKDPISLYATIDQDNDTQFQDLIEDKEAPDTIDRV
ncbi:MAG: sigma-70 family RNA polymerase sigma factor [Candidatus Ancillula sp.]|jgi:RNA polymerase primary sigma factor|nr:sigma-70 family RNA polymerase sigma factor [Candidatus Ancillula sp.]